MNSERVVNRLVAMRRAMEVSMLVRYKTPRQPGVEQTYETVVEATDVTKRSDGRVTIYSGEDCEVTIQPGEEATDVWNQTCGHHHRAMAEAHICAHGFIGATCGLCARDQRGV